MSAIEEIQRFRDAKQLIWSGAIEESYLMGMLDEIKRGIDVQATLWITSGGGDINLAWCFYGFIRCISPELMTVAVGNVESAAVTVFLAGNKRYALPTASFLLHDVQSVSDENGYGATTDARICEDEQRRYIDLLTSELTIPREEVVAISSATTLLSAQEAKEIGLVHEILETAR